MPMIVNYIIQPRLPQSTRVHPPRQLHESDFKAPYFNGIALAPGERKTDSDCRAEKLSRPPIVIRTGTKDLDTARLANLPLAGSCQRI